MSEIESSFGAAIEYDDQVVERYFRWVINSVCNIDFISLSKYYLTVKIYFHFQNIISLSKYHFTIKI